MHWFKRIMITVFLLEFILVSFFTMMMIPITHIEGRIAMFIWVALIILFSVWGYFKAEELMKVK